MYTKKSGLVRYRLDVYSSNGLTWDTKRNKFYYIDSCKFDIKQYDWDPSTGIICMLCVVLNWHLFLTEIFHWKYSIENIPFIQGNEKIAYDFRINGEFAGYTADGMAIDQDGLLWIGLFKGDSIIAVDPRWYLIHQTYFHYRVNKNNTFSFAVAIKLWKISRSRHIRWLQPSLVVPI